MMVALKRGKLGLNFSIIPDIPLVKQGDAIDQIIGDAIAASDLVLSDGDIVVVAQKIISKAEGCLVQLSDVTPSDEAIALAKETEKEPALCQLILDESSDVLRKKPGVVIVRHRLGHVGANAGIDQSNVEQHEGETALLLPRDPDRSAHELCASLGDRFGCHLGVIVADSMNRPWRLGTIGGAIGCANVEILDDLRGGVDMFGRELKVAMVNRADALAAAATLLMGESTEGTPVVVVQGYDVDGSQQVTADMVRPLEEDLFR